ncbi:hypothetical protein LTS08_004680 [Lithohypha guttulata]|nr:hypothetical protein LTS08_004680 [Lithohypha guttulata]
MYLLIAFNVILDLLMGCTSGGVKSLEKGQLLSAARMLHFRTLDWSMDPLRRVVVQLDFVRTPEKVIATSITYVGFTGVLTGVRPGLSMSLNFRGTHENSTKMAQFRFYLHHLLVLVGRRPSIATHLRKYLTGDHEAVEASSRSRWSRMSNANQNMQASRPLRLAEIHDDLCKHHTTAAYLIFSDGDTTVSIDKDFQTAKPRQSQSFIATTNHDVLQHGTEQKENAILAGDNAVAVRRVAGLEEFIDESEDRLKCIADRWKRHLAKQRKEVSENGHFAQAQDSAHGATLTSRQVVNWVSKYPTTNEATHYAAVMDPRAGRVIWCLAHPEPPS